MSNDGMFQLDDAQLDALPSSVASTGSGTMTPSRAAVSEVDLCRKAISVAEVEKDVCSICLDEFTEEDPSVATLCEHGYHLQCIMQWAQRSRECPLCFHTLQLQDSSLNELLPFGEYISPAQTAAAAASLEPWDLERLLVQLAAANRRHERRSAREAARALRRRNGGELTMPQPIRHATSSGAVAGRRHSVEGVLANDGGSGDGAGPSLAHAGSSELPAASPSSPSVSSEPGAYPASWPPASARTLAGRGGDEGPSSSRQHGQQHGLSPSLKAASASIKKGFAALKIRESFSKTTKELKAMFSHSASSSSSGHRPDRRPGEGTAGS